MYELLYNYIKDKIEMDQETFSKINSFFKPKAVKRDEFVVNEGDICHHNIFVNKGCLKIYSISDEGKELIRYFAFEGKFGTALSSFIEKSPSFEYVQAIEASEILMIHHHDFFHLVNTVPQLNFIYRDILEMAYITSQKRIYGLQGNTALDRLKWLMVYQPKVLSRLSNKVIASYLGVTPYTLSRLKAEL